MPRAGGRHEATEPLLARFPRNGEASEKLHNHLLFWGPHMGRYSEKPLLPGTKTSKRTFVFLFEKSSQKLSKNNLFCHCCTVQGQILHRYLLIATCKAEDENFLLSFFTG